MKPFIKKANEKEEILLPTWVAVVTIFVSIIGAVLAAFSLDSHLKAVIIGPAYQSFCNINQTVNCDNVARSDWSSFFGFPLPAITLAFYLVAIIYGIGSLITKKVRSADIQFVVMLVVMIFSLFLLYVSLFKIKALCLLCVGMDVVNFILLISAYLGGERDISFGERIFQGIKGVLELPMAILGIGEYSESTESTVTLGGFLLSLAAIFLTIYGTMRLNNSIKKSHLSTFSVEAYEREVKKIVEEWKTARVEEIPLILTNEEDADYIKGPSDAPIKIVEFSDFQCPHCRVVASVVDEAIKGYEDKVAFVNKAYPLDPICNQNISGAGHSSACRAAKYARCAGEQGKFWEAFYALNQLEALDLDSAASDIDYKIKRELKSIGVDSIKLGDCFDSDRQLEKIRRDIALGDKIGVKGTPTFFINGKKIKAVEVVTLRKVFDEILKTQSAP